MEALKVGIEIIRKTIEISGTNNNNNSNNSNSNNNISVPIINL